MVGFLSGKVISKHSDSHTLIVATGRVGYEVIVPRSHFDRVHVGEKTALWIHTHVREDQLTLFGFSQDAEKTLFRLLLSVSGLGPKSAIALLGHHEAERLARYIREKATDEIAEAPGIGKKLAQRLVLELGSKLEKLALLQLEPPSTKTANSPVSTSTTSLRDDLSSALTNLGYQPQQIKNVLDRLFKKELESQSFEACLRLALTELSGRTRPSTVEVNAHG